MEAAASSDNDNHRRRFVLNLPPGYHFSPTEDELIVDYLRPQMAGLPLPLPIFQHDRIISYRPDQIVEKYREYGEDRWFFFTTRERKYAKGNRPNRTTPDNGYWKATGGQREIKSGGALVGRVRTLVFYIGPEKNEDEDFEEEMDESATASSSNSKLAKTEWTMYEYENLASEAEARDKNIDKLDELVLCSIQKNKRCDNEKGKKKDKECSPASGSGEEGSPASSSGEEGSSAGINGEEGSPAGSCNGEEGSRAGDKKRKRKRKEKIKSENGTGQRRQQACPPMKKSMVPMPPQEPPHSAMVAPVTAGDNYNCYNDIDPNMGMVGYPNWSMNMEMVQYSCGHPVETSQGPPRSEMMSLPAGDSYNIGGSSMLQMQPRQEEEPLPHSEMMRMPPPVSFNGNIGPNMAPMQWQQRPTHSEMMPAPLVGVNRNIDPIILPTPQQEWSHSEMVVSPPQPGGYAHSIDPATGIPHDHYEEAAAAVASDAAWRPHGHGGIYVSDASMGHHNGYPYPSLEKNPSAQPYLQPNSLVPPQVYGGTSNNGYANDALHRSLNGDDSGYYQLGPYAAGAGTGIQGMFMHSGVMMSHNHGGFYGSQSQYLAGRTMTGVHAPEVHGPSSIIRPELPRQDSWSALIDSST